jgi:hypothetical protein
LGKLTGVALDGKSASFAQVLPHLITIWKREGFYRRSVWLCGCDAGPCGEVPASEDGPAELPGGAWNVCPYSLLRSVQFRALQSLDACAKISPLANWPDAYPAWVAWGLATLRARMGDGK